MNELNRLEILVEERSMEVFLTGLLPRILPGSFELGVNCFVYPHEGKSDLQKRLPYRLKAYKNYPERVILLVIQDQDSSDCKELKRKLEEIIQRGNADLKYLIRIACRELENWYLGDFIAVEKIYPRSRASTLTGKAKYRNVDNVFGSQEMENISKGFTKISCAREISKIIDYEQNRSTSFQHFLGGLKKLIIDNE